MKEALARRLAHSKGIAWTVKNRTAWTGGSSPRPWHDLGPKEKQIVKTFFLDQVADYSCYWGTLPDLSTARILWNRARHDAHATCRH